MTGKPTRGPAFPEVADERQGLPGGDYGQARADGECLGNVAFARQGERTDPSGDQVDLLPENVVGHLQRGPESHRSPCSGPVSVLHPAAKMGA